MVDDHSRPLTPLINWQDKRGHDPMPAVGRSYLDVARERLGEKAAARTGCRLHPGFSGLTLFWMKENGRLPAGGRACFIMDLFGGILAAVPPVTEPSCAGSSGLFNVRTRSWDSEAIAALGLPDRLFPEVREADEPVGPLGTGDGREDRAACGNARLRAHRRSSGQLPRQSPRFASRRAGQRRHGAQVAVYTEGWRFAAPVELRPLPMRHNLLSNVGLAGGWSYQILENFFRRISTRRVRTRVRQAGLRNAQSTRCVRSTGL